MNINCNHFNYLLMMFVDPLRWEGLYHEQYCAQTCGGKGQFIRKVDFGI